MNRHKRMFITVEVEGFPSLDDLVAQADEHYDGDVQGLLVDEWIYSDLGLTFVGMPGDKCMNDEFTVFGCTGRLRNVEVKS